AVAGAAEVRRLGHRTGSTDMGDVTHVMPAIHPYAGGATGTGHGADYRIADPEAAILAPAKAMAMTVLDLLAGGAAPGILDAFRPRFTPPEDRAHLRHLRHTQT